MFIGIASICMDCVLTSGRQTYSTSSHSLRCFDLLLPISAGGFLIGFMLAICYQTKQNSHVGPCVISSPHLPWPNFVTTHPNYAHRAEQIRGANATVPLRTVVHNSNTFANMVQECCGAEVRSSTFGDMAREFVRLATSLANETGSINSIQTSYASVFRSAAIVGLLLVLLVSGVFWCSKPRRHLELQPTSKFVNESTGAEKNK